MSAAAWLSKGSRAFLESSLPAAALSSSAHTCELQTRHENNIKVRCPTHRQVHKQRPVLCISEPHWVQQPHLHSTKICAVGHAALDPTAAVTARSSTAQAVDAPHFAACSECCCAHIHPGGWRAMRPQMPPATTEYLKRTAACSTNEPWRPIAPTSWLQRC